MSSRAIEKAGQADSDRDLAMASTVIRPTVQAAVTLKACSQASSELDVGALIEVLTERTSAIIGGDLSRSEAMLTAQAHTLDAIYNHLTCQAISVRDAGRLDTLLKLALRAQSQSRATWETLSRIKYPPSVS